VTEISVEIQKKKSYFTVLVVILVELNGLSGSLTHFLSVGSPFIEEGGKMP
jgi:hypothetical protein